MIKTPDIYQLKVKLIDTTPSIWRRIQVPDDLFLHDLHKVLQTVMGWENAHLHEFRKNGKILGFSEDEEVPDHFIDYTSIRLNDLLKKTGDRMIYLYDLGDQWEHDLVLEQILGPDEQRYYPYCLEGQRNCPPEDCGGPDGYQNLLKVYHMPGHPDHDELLDWLDMEWEPEDFDLELTNLLLQENDFGCLPLLSE